MLPVLIGGAAMAMHFPDYRKIKDYDYFTDEKLPKVMADGKHIEKFYHPDLENWSWGPVASIDELYTIKVSHLFWTNRWVKHAKDAIFLSENGAVLIDELYDVLYPIWVEHYGAKRASLPKGTKAEDFFLKTVDRKYDHDSIHASVAYYDRPLFNLVLQDGEDVAVSWKKFQTLPEHMKYELVREEIYATALERKMIPSNYETNSLAAYRWALQQTCTSFWKGRWAQWVVLHLKELQRPDIDYVQKHHDNSERLVLL